MISKAQIQYIRGLQDKKQRQKYSQFIVEGEKSITELLTSRLTVSHLYLTEACYQRLEGSLHAQNYTLVSDRELKQISSHHAPQGALAIVEIPEWKSLDKNENLVIGLDEVQDPGNLGTIIRLADWFGVKTIVCSKGTTDAYSPKCINSCMGSILRVKVIYSELIEFADKNHYKICTADLDGQNVHEFQVPENAMLVMGNEGRGISETLSQKSDYIITIPGVGAAESLNVAMSTAIILDNINRLRKSE